MAASASGAAVQVGRMAVREPLAWTAAPAGLADAFRLVTQSEAALEPRLVLRHVRHSLRPAREAKLVEDPADHSAAAAVWTETRAADGW